MSTGRCSPEPSRECKSMFLTMESARLPCCTIFSRLPRSVSISSVISEFIPSSSLTRPIASFSSSRSSPETPEKLLTKLSAFLISWAIPAVSWPSEASFCVHQAVLRRLQFLKRVHQFARARFLAFKQANIFNRNRRLVRERRHQLNLFVGEWPHINAG